jgi:hypothetical protein
MGFLLRFAVIFGLLIAPWRGWNEAYSHYFQSLYGFLFNWGQTNRVVTLQPSPPSYAPLDTQVILANASLVDSAGRGPIRRTEFDSRSIGWVPTALTLALVAATPIPWRRRLAALAGGMVLIHLFIFFSLQSWIWNNSVQLSLLTLSAFWQRAVDELDYLLMNQLGASFTVPVVIWILVTFRRQDALAA